MTTEYASDVTEEVNWFGEAEEPDFEPGARFYADGSVRVPTAEEIDGGKRRMRRYYFVQNQAKKRSADKHEWRDRDGWSMVIHRRAGIIAVREGGRIVDYRDGFQAWITHPERYVRRQGRLADKSYIRTQFAPYRGLAVADGLELMSQHRLLRRQRAAREARERMADEHRQVGKLMSCIFADWRAIDEAAFLKRWRSR